MLGIIILICVFSITAMVSDWCSQIMAKQATSKLVRPLADYSGHTVQERWYEVVRANLQR